MTLALAYLIVSVYWLKNLFKTSTTIPWMHEGSLWLLMALDWNCELCVTWWFLSVSEISVPVQSEFKFGGGSKEKAAKKKSGTTQIHLSINKRLMLIFGWRSTSTPYLAKMSRRKSASVLDMPVTPLLEPQPGQENPFSEEGEADTTRRENNVQEDPPATPRNFDNNLHLTDRRKKSFACAGNHK